MLMKSSLGSGNTHNSMKASCVVQCMLRLTMHDGARKDSQCSLRLPYNALDSGENSKPDQIYNKGGGNSSQLSARLNIIGHFITAKSLAHCSATTYQL